MTNAEGEVTHYDYDSLNRLINIEDIQGHNFGFSYDGLSRRTQMTRPNGVTTNYSYDALSRLLSVAHQAGTTTLDGATYTYDLAGNRTSKTDLYANVTSNYSYDNIYQLTGVTQGTSTTESYTYDAVGNRLSSLGVSPYQYNTSNELSSTPSATYTYDHNGNLKSKTDATGTTNYTWDYSNRLVQVTLPGTGGTVTFKYDPFGRRVQKSGPNGTVNYLYDGATSIEELDNNGNVLARYTQGDDVDEPFSEIRSGTTNYYEQDGLGSISTLSNSAGSLASTYNYDSFGKLTTSTGTLTNPLQYTGRELDSETGLYYYRARYYDVVVGRFISEDPKRFVEGVDFFSYAQNRPTSFVDPWGLSACCADKERSDIEDRIKEIDRYLHLLETTGTVASAVEAGATVKGTTICLVGPHVKGHPEIPLGPNEYKYKIDPDYQAKHPCLADCADAHERVHASQCEQYGVAFSKRSEAQNEIPAYKKEKQCLIRLLGGK